MNHFIISISSAIDFSDSHGMDFSSRLSSIIVVLVCQTCLTPSCFRRGSGVDDDDDDNDDDDDDDGDDDDDDDDDDDEL